MIHRFWGIKICKRRHILRHEIVCLIKCRILYHYQYSRNRLQVSFGSWKSPRSKCSSDGIPKVWNLKCLEGKRFYESVFLEKSYEFIWGYPRSFFITQKRSKKLFDHWLQNLIAPFGLNWVENGPFPAKSEIWPNLKFWLKLFLKTLFLWILGFSAISGRARSIVFFGAFDLTMTKMSIREHFQPSVI